MTRLSSAYVLVTPARNEAGNIEQTLESVMAQTIPPLRWIIVDDGSTDATVEIVRHGARHARFIELLRRPPGARRDFASKVRAIGEAYEKLREDDFGFFGNLDADIVLPPTYYGDMLSCFEQNPRLGIAGGRIVDRGQDPAEGRFFSLDSVGCAVQFFRRRCYEQIGGYLPLPIGGEDAAAEIMARMHGWRVRTFPEVQVMHLRSTGQGLGTVWRARYFTGVENYTLGYHPLFFVLKCLKRIRQSPAFIGSFFMLLGYAWAGLKGQPHLLQPGVVAYLRNEQRAKMYSRLLRRSG